MVEMAKKTKTLVLLHGWGLNHRVWQQFLLKLPDAIQVVTLDIPGYGNSPAPQPYSLDAVVEQLSGQIPAQSVVIGWSLGGLLAIKLASRYPDKVARLGLLASSPYFMAEPGWPGMQTNVMHQFAAALQNDLALTLDRFLAIQAMGSTTARHDIKLLRQAVLSLPLPTTETLSQGLVWLQQLDCRSELASLTQPVSGLFGRLDSLVPVAVVDQLTQLCPQGQWQIADKASHAPFISHPDLCLSWVLNVLK